MFECPECKKPITNEIVKEVLRGGKDNDLPHKKKGYILTIEYADCECGTRVGIYEDDYPGKNARIEEECLPSSDECEHVYGSYVDCVNDELTKFRFNFCPRCGEVLGEEE